MEAIHLYAVAANLMVSIVFMAVAARLLLLARKTRQLPEVLLGSSFLTVGFALPALVSFPFLAEGLLQKVIRNSGTALVSASIALVLIFVYRVFRSNSRGALGGALGIGAALVMSWFFDVLSLGETRTGVVMDLVGSAAQMATYAWAATETFLYQRNLRRRQRLGLAPESSVANRMALFCLGFSLTTILYSWGFLATALRAFTQIQLPTLFVTSSLGFGVSIAFWLAFFPLKSADPAENS